MTIETYKTVCFTLFGIAGLAFIGLGYVMHRHRTALVKEGKPLPRVGLFNFLYVFGPSIGAFILVAMSAFVCLIAGITDPAYATAGTVLLNLGLPIIILANAIRVAIILRRERLERSGSTTR